MQLVQLLRLETDTTASSTDAGTEVDSSGTTTAEVEAEDTDTTVEEVVGEMLRLLKTALPMRCQQMKEQKSLVPLQLK